MSTPTGPATRADADSPAPVADAAAPARAAAVAHTRDTYARCRTRLATLGTYRAGWLDGDGAAPRPDLLEVAAALLAKLEAATLAELGARTSWEERCPTDCDTDCEALCHESHQVLWHRAHPADSCVGALSVLGGPGLFVLEDGGLLLEWHLPRHGIVSAELGDDPLPELLTATTDAASGRPRIDRHPWAVDDDSLPAVLAAFARARSGARGC